MQVAYSGLINLDLSNGKSRQEKISGLRHLIAASYILNRDKTNTIDLSVGSSLRTDFIEAVGNVVSLDNTGKYSKDFSEIFDKKKDYGVGSNFYTTRLAASRYTNIEYPGRPGSLLLLEEESVSILSNVSTTLHDLYGIGEIKAALCIWLLRDENFDVSTASIPENELHTLINTKLRERYTLDVVEAIMPTSADYNQLLKNQSDYFHSEKANYFLCAVPDKGIAPEKETTSKGAPSNKVQSSNVLINDLSEDDNIFKVVQQLLTRGTKGLLFSGPPGTSKTWYALKIALKLIDGEENQLERIQFHPAYTYEDFIEGMISTGSVAGNEPMFQPKDKVFLTLCTKARVDSDNLHIMIIDEFSRGDPSKIFGELLTYIEADYRGVEFKLPYSEKVISIPDNVVIFATMNPYDKSVVDLDSAMERRFDVIELLPNAEILSSLLSDNDVDGTVKSSVFKFFNAINRLSPHGFGHTYFKDIRDEEDFILLWNHKLKFIFKKMFRFKDDSYDEVRDAYLEIISDQNKSLIR